MPKTVHARPVSASMTESYNEEGKLVRQLLIVDSDGDIFLGYSDDCLLEFVMTEVKWTAGQGNHSFSKPLPFVRKG